MTALATVTRANRAIFGIKHTEVRDLWMIDDGNLQSQIGAIFFDTREEAQRFLDTRRLRRGFRPKLAVAEVCTETVLELAECAREYASGEPPESPRAYDCRPYYRERAEYLAAFLPLAA